MTDYRYSARLLSPAKADDLGHLSVHLGVNREKFTAMVHTLVLLSFVGPCPEGLEACHGNGIASDNSWGNLRWDTHFENNQDRKRHGTYALGEAHPMAKLNADAVREMRRSGLGCAEASRKFGIGMSQAHRILAGKAWKHV
jgi:hypothetical protein